MALELVTPPADLPVTLADAKLYVRQDLDHHDTLIQALIGAATAYLDGADGVLCRCLVTQTWALVVDAFPAGAVPLRLPLPPVSAVQSVTYVDTAGATQTWDPGAYVVDTAGARLFPTLGTGYPPTAPVPSAVRVTYDAGVAVDALSPADKEIVLMLVAHWYDHPEPGGAGSTGMTLPDHLDRLIADRRHVTIA
jgi:uncharacterized phiE125 gp8 family phage protein